MEQAEQENIPPARSYQQEMLDASLKRNVVIALDTGETAVLEHFHCD